MNHNTHRVFPLAAITAALFSIYGSAWADESDAQMQALTKPDSSFRLGAGYLTSAGSRFGQYTGVRDQDTYALVDLDFVKRDDATGTWVKAAARNLGLNNRDLRISHERQGDWGYYFDYNQTPRYEPLMINSSVSGIGTTQQTHGAAAAPRPDVQLKTQREGYGVGFSKQLGGGFDVQLNARTEEKDGARLSGNYVSNKPSFLTEPISSTTRQWEGTLGYRGEKLQLSAGYYGSAYVNGYAKVDTFAPASTTTLPPDNHSHQFFLSGGYAFTPTTRGTFKVSSTKASQNDQYIAPATLVVPQAGQVRTSLNGEVETVLVQMGLTARPTPKLSLLANVRHEDRDDKTRQDQYLTVTGSRDGRNVPFSRRVTTGKAEASYLLPMSFRLTGGIDVEDTKRSIPSRLRQISWREKNDETSYRLELRRSLSDTLNGAVSCVRSERGGSDFLSDSSAAGGDVTDPIHWADRDREKVRLSLDWTPTESLSLQFMVDAANDTYRSAQRRLGPDTGKGRLYSIDAAYSLSDAWQLTAWLSRDENHMNQSQITESVPGLAAGIREWTAKLSATGNAVGFGMRGKASEKLQVGADLQFVEDTNKYNLTQFSPTIGSLPNIDYRTTSLKLFGTYAIEKNSSVRLDYIYDRRTTNDWTWDAWNYGIRTPAAGLANDTTVTQDKNQNVQFIAVSYIRKF
jgi:MtrB/PioB family decaheme-associated outer membrane protein